MGRVIEMSEQDISSNFQTRILKHYYRKTKLEVKVEGRKLRRLCAFNGISCQPERPPTPTAQVSTMRLAATGT